MLRSFSVLFALGFALPAGAQESATAIQSVTFTGGDMPLHVSRNTVAVRLRLRGSDAIPSYGSWFVAPVTVAIAPGPPAPADLRVELTLLGEALQRSLSDALAAHGQSVATTPAEHVLALHATITDVVPRMRASKASEPSIASGALLSLADSDPMRLDLERIGVTIELRDAVTTQRIGTLAATRPALRAMTRKQPATWDAVRSSFDAWTDDVAVALVEAHAAWPLAPDGERAAGPAAEPPAK